MSEPDPLAGLRDQIRSAAEAAERLVGDARGPQSPPARPRPAGPPRTPPPAGWQQAEPTDAPADLAALLRLLEQLRELLPSELQQQVTELLRQLLIVLRSLIDWAVTRFEQEGRGREVEVEDIPIG